MRKLLAIPAIIGAAALVVLAAPTADARPFQPVPDIGLFSHVIAEQPNYHNGALADFGAPFLHQGGPTHNYAW